jgi:hypothetical protein
MAEIKSVNELLKKKTQSIKTGFVNIKKASIHIIQKWIFTIVI